MRSRFALMWGMVCLGFAADCRGQSAPNFQKGETILAVDKAPADAPLRRTEKFPWYQLSNLRKGGGKAGRVPSPLAEFSIDYVRDDGVSMALRSFLSPVLPQEGKSTVHGAPSHRLQTRAIPSQPSQPLAPFRNAWGMISKCGWSLSFTLKVNPFDSKCQTQCP